ncbi:carbohydrate binding domain-containing protein [Clostridium intestinale]|uniref:carbohydrate binding domain-containing protein n=1 Tax=Clostridium intestinale TaxID=36845 RepID=UPI0028E1A786|nr:carbohydrate binding domain-containing protein [Clostridium intestinale]
MYSTSAAYKTEIKKPSRSFECKITIGDRIYNNSDIVNVTIDGNIQPSDGFMIGTTVSETLDLTLINSGDTIYSTSQVKVEIGLKIGQTIEYIPMGLFNIDDIEKTDYTTKITAFDNMIKFESAYFSSLGDSPTLQQVVNELAAKTGVQFTGSLPTYTVKKLEGFTCREIVGYVASICGGNAVITRDGKFTIVTLADVSLSIDPNNYINYKREEVKYKVGKVTCRVGEEELSKGPLGTDSMELGFENPWITNNILQDIYTKLNGFNYLGYSMKWQGDLSLDVGDIVTVTDVKGVVRKHPVLSQKINYTGGLTAEIGAKGENKNKNSFSSSGDTTKKLNRVVTEVAIVNKAFVDYAHINDADIVNLKAETAKIDTAIINIATINTLLAGNITAVNIATGAITAGSGIIADGAIGNAQISSISAVKIDTGTLDTSKVAVAGANGRLTIINNKLQVFDEKANGSLYERIVLGDINGDGSIYGLKIRGAEGATILLDENGLTNQGFTDGYGMLNDNSLDPKKIDIEKVVTRVNGATTKIVGSKISLNNSTLDVQFSNLSTTVTTQGETISSQASSINALDNKINLKVDTQTYTTKMSSLDGSIGTITTNLNKATGDISVLQSQISLKVEQSDITTAINNVQIGGRNLLVNSTFNSQTDSWNGMSQIGQVIEAEEDKPSSNILNVQYLANSSNTLIYSSKRVSVKADGTEKITVSFDIFISVEGDVLDNVTLSSNRLVSTSNGSDWSTFGTILFSHIKSKVVYGKWSRVTYTLAIPDSVKKYLVMGLYRSGVSSETKYKLREIKIEFGDKSTTWTPANEDITSYTDTQISTAKAEIKLTTDSISSTVNSVQSSISDLGTRVTSAESSITSLNSSITLKVNTTDFTSYKTMNDSAVNSKASQSSVTALTTRVSTTESSISVMQGQISLKVEQSDIENAVSSAQQGQNLIPDCSFENGALGWGDGGIIVDDPHSGSKSLRLSTSSKTKSIKKNIIVVPGNKYKLSFWYKTSSDNNGTVDNQKLRIGGVDGGLLTALAAMSISTVWVQATKTWTAPSNVTEAKVSISTDLTTGWIQYDDISFIDITDIDSAVTRISAAELKITDSAIVNTVRTSTGYTNDLAAKANQSQITQLSTQISSKVSTGDFGTLITQNISSVRIAVGQIGGNNLLKNSCFLFDLTSWSTFGSPSEATVGSSTLGYIKSLKITTNASNQGVRQYVTVRVNTTYTLSAKVYCSSGQAALQAAYDGNYPTRYTSKTNAWEDLSITFTTTNINTVSINLCKAGGGATGTYFFTAVKLEEGDNVTAWSANTNEATNVSVDISDNGLKVRNGAISILNNAGVEVLKGDTAGNLSIRGDFTNYDTTTGNMAIRITNRTIDFNDWDSNSICGTIFAGKLVGQTSTRGMSFGAKRNKYLDIAYEDSNGNFAAAIRLDNGALGTTGKAHVYDGGSANFTSLYVSGSKNCIQDTKNYGKRLLYAYETTESYLGDLGFGKINEDGECLISTDEIFGECVNTNIEYHVFTQVYHGSISRIERCPNYFVVKGEIGSEFSWELKAKRTGFEHVRLEEKYVEQYGAESIEDELKQVLSTDIEEELYGDLADELLEG